MGYSEKEFLITNQQLAFKLRELYFKDVTKFKELEEFLPFSIHINNKDNLDVIYANDRFINKGPELVNLKNYGGQYLKQISCPKLLDIALKKANQFKFNNDFNEVSPLLQKIQVNKNMSYMLSNKLHLDKNSYFNISNFTEDIGALGKLVNDILNHLKANNIGWQQFQSLTKQEKIILELISNGLANKEIANQLFVSLHTIQTHRKNIYRKTNTNNIAGLIHFNNALKLFEI